MVTDQFNSKLNSFRDGLKEMMELFDKYLNMTMGSKVLEKPAIEVRDGFKNEFFGNKEDEKAFGNMKARAASVRDQDPQHPLNEGVDNDLAALKLAGQALLDEFEFDYRRAQRSWNDAKNRAHTTELKTYIEQKSKQCAERRSSWRQALLKRTKEQINGAGKEDLQKIFDGDIKVLRDDQIDDELQAIETLWRERTNTERLITILVRLDNLLGKADSAHSSLQSSCRLESVKDARENLEQVIPEAQDIVLHLAEGHPRKEEFIDLIQKAKKLKSEVDELEPKARQFNDLIAEAKNNFQNDEFNQALASYNGAYKICSKDELVNLNKERMGKIVSYWNSGTNHEERGEFRQARKEYMEAQNYAAKSPLLANKLTIVEDKLKQQEFAEKEQKKEDEEKVKAAEKERQIQSWFDEFQKEVHVQQKEQLTKARQLLDNLKRVLIPNDPRLLQAIKNFDQYRGALWRKIRTESESKRENQNQGLREAREKLIEAEGLFTEEDKLTSDYLTYQSDLITLDGKIQSFDNFFNKGEEELNAWRLVEAKNNYGIALNVSMIDQKAAGRKTLVEDLEEAQKLVQAKVDEIDWKTKRDDWKKALGSMNRIAKSRNDSDQLVQNSSHFIELRKVLSEKITAMEKDYIPGLLNQVLTSTSPQALVHLKFRVEQLNIECKWIRENIDTEIAGRNLILQLYESTIVNVDRDIGIVDDILTNIHRIIDSKQPKCWERARKDLTTLERRQFPYAPGYKLNIVHLKEYKELNEEIPRLGWWDLWGRKWVFGGVGVAIFLVVIGLSLGPYLKERFGSPTPPELTRPPDGSTVPTLAPEFTWEKATYAEKYQVRLSRDPSFPSGQTITPPQPVLSTSWRAEPKLEPGTTYYWSVRSMKGAKDGEWSLPAWRFSTPVKPPSPQLVSPPEGQMIVINRPILRWSEIKGSANYEIQVSTFPTFPSGQDTLNSPKVSDTLWQVAPDLEEGKVYYWRVRAVSDVTEGDWSANKIFRITPPVILLTMGPQEPPIILKWQEMKGASYQAAVSISPDFPGGAGTSVVPNIRTASFQIATPLDENKTYYWRVQAVWEGNPGPWSSTESFNVQQTILPPKPIPSPKPGIFSWEEVKGVTNYEVQISSDQAFTALLVSTRVPGGSWQVNPPLEDGRNYQWRVRAFKGEVAGPWSRAETLSIPLELPVPKLLEPIDRPTNTWPTLKIEGNKKATGYQLQYSIQETFPPDKSFARQESSDMEWKVPSELERGKRYYWRARSVKGDILGEWSLPSSFYVPFDPPALKSPSPGIETANINIVGIWTEVKGAEFYEVEVSQYSNFTPNNTTRYKPKASSASWQFPSLEEGRTYYWRVRALGEGVEGLWPEKPWTFATPLTPPSLDTPPNGGPLPRERAFVSWREVTEAFRYEVEVSEDADFSRTIVSSGVIGSSAWQVPQDKLTIGKTYYWRVKSLRNIDSKGRPSTARMFVVIPASSVESKGSP